jgi:hypothetical protein
MQFRITANFFLCYENDQFKRIKLTCCADRGRDRATEAAKRADNIDISDFHSVNCREIIFSEYRVNSRSDERFLELMYDE